MPPNKAVQCYLCSACDLLAALWQLFPMAVVLMSMKKNQEEISSVKDLYISFISLQLHLFD